MFFTLLFATDLKNGGFSYLSNLPWKISKDMKYFRSVTLKEYKKDCKNVLIMGKNTFLSKPTFNDRIELVLSNKNNENNYFTSFTSLENCLNYCDSISNQIGKVFVIGGKDLLENSIKDPRCEEVLMSAFTFDKDITYDSFIDYNSIINGLYQCTTDVCDDTCKINNCNVSINFKRYLKYKTSENNYLNLLRSVIDHGEERIDRTKTGTISLFGSQIEIDIENSFPLLTTKKLNFKNIVTEVLWFLSGSTNTKFLIENGVNIWSGNTSREFLDKRGLTDYKEGDIGPLYGYQWRNFGGDFHNPNSKGVDQIERMLTLLRTDPTSRRIFMSAWNPTDLDKMVLEPCHLSLQLYVSENKYLDGKLYMRSNDLFLGAPWNIAGYSLLIYMFAHLSGYKPRKLYYTIGDSHIYSNHINQVQEQITRNIRLFPKLVIKKQHNSFEDFTIDSFELLDYNPHPFIKANMAV